MSIEAMKQALEALERIDIKDWAERKEAARKALRQAIEQAEKQRPVAWLEGSDWGELFVSRERNGSFPVYTAPPKREWIGLTDEEEIELDEKYGDDINAYIEARDAKLKEKNT